MSGRGRTVAVVLQAVVALPQQMGVAAGQVVDDFAVLPTGRRRGSRAAVVVAQTEERPPKVLRARAELRGHGR